MPIKIKIEEVLEKKGRTIYWLAKEIGITYKSMHNICKNRTTSIQFSILEKTCEALNCNLSDIIELQKSYKVEK
ncbi:helix-turn-helix domain-containing protein [Clostridium felsineum]|uniref:helix-turn-helix domain-containing protein n=1 Tax=Clostridium felsineum TaxID=36839 RepID=UPI0009C4F1DA|nr:helix-turn-helix transcriptional regulator [Clostridium felsineum]URZ18776.1 hypothetical protein CLFE_048640 [Clostridium felsineum DSM 794]